MSNKYGSVRLTYTSNPLFNDLLSTLGTPPADITLTFADFTTEVLYCEVQQIGTTEARLAFALNDHPRIVGAGVFCNMGDGLVNVTPTEVFQDNMVLTLTLISADATGAIIDTLDIRNIKIPELNQVFDADFLMAVASVGAVPGATQLRILVTLSPLELIYSTISLNPDFAAKPLRFVPVVIIESNQLPDMDD
jgi:hypothetical protein